MATIVGGIASSHTPTIGFALDTNKQQDAVWAPIFEGYEPVQRWLAEKQPDVLFFIFNDHITSFFFDHYSHFALGVGERYQVADEGGGARKLPPIMGHPGLARHVAPGSREDFEARRGSDARTRRAYRAHRHHRGRQNDSRNTA